MIGEVIGNYRIEAVLGQGGMGVVYRAEHVTLGRAVAVKMLQPSISHDAGMVQRFFNEARASSAIDHPGIVEIFDFGTHTDGRAYIAMALLQGESLEGRLRRAGPLSPMLGASLLAQAASALAAAHARGIVHRDLKPDNIFLVPNEMMPDGLQIKLLDFGIAKLANDQSTFKTQTGALMGTPAYMSPEQCMGASDLDHRTDIYSLGCILFHVLTGRPPFKSDHGTGMLIAAHLRDEAPDVRSIDPNIPESLALIVRRCLEKDKAVRFQTALELRQALVDAGAHSPTQPGQSVPRNPSPPSQRFTGAEAYGQTVAPGTDGAPLVTTHRSAAAQLVAAPPAPKKSSPFVILGVLVVLAAVGGGAAFFVSRGGGTTTSKQSQPPPPPVAVDAGTHVVQNVVDAATEIAQVPVEECPDGQERTADTAGHCCWRDQAWSSAKSRCIGVPRCPDGTEKKGESCTKVARLEVKPSKTEVTPTTPVQTASSFTLADASVPAGQDLVFKFPARVASVPGDQTWVSISDAGSLDTSYITWAFVADKATAATLEVPKKPGSYEARLYTHYPKQQYNLVSRTAFTITELAEAPEAGATVEKFTLAASTLAPGQKIKIVFPAPMIAAPGEQYWVTVVLPTASSSAYDAWEYVAPKARSATLPAPANPGTYEVRLHANYPKKSSNVVFRAPLTVR